MPEKVPNNTAKDIVPEQYTLERSGPDASGNYHSVTLMQGKIGRRIIQLVRRSPKDILPSPLQRQDPHQELAMRNRLKALGIAVIPTFRIAKNGDVYATDLSRGGKNHVLSASNRSFEHKDLANQIMADETPRQPTTNPDAVLQKAFFIARTCAENGIEITNPDALFLIMEKETNESDVCAGDYKHFRVSEQPKKELLSKNMSVCREIFSSYYIEGLLQIDPEAIARVFPE